MSTIVKAPVLTKRQIREALNYYARHINSPAWEDDYEDVIGRVLAAAVAGNNAARRSLAEMPANFELDGHSGEVYQEAIAFYKLCVDATQRLPDLLDP